MTDRIQPPPNNTLSTTVGRLDCQKVSVGVELSQYIMAGNQTHWGHRTPRLCPPGPVSGIDTNCAVSCRY